jgi:hypothetical protein
LWHQDRLLATAAPVGAAAPDADRLVPVPAGPVETFAGFGWHPFPSCFVCGTERTDGLRLFPTTAGDRSDTVTADWTPAPELADGDRLVRPEFLWAALDCPGGWSAMPPGCAEALVLARFTVRLSGRARSGRPHTVVGRLDRRAGRTAWVRTALFDEGGTALATGRAQWLSVDPARFQPADGPHDSRALPPQAPPAITTTVGDMELRIPKLRTGSLLPAADSSA